MMARIKQLKLTTKVLLTTLMIWLVTLSGLVISGLSSTQTRENMSHTPATTGTGLIGQKPLELAPYHQINLEIPVTLEWQPSDASRCLSNIDEGNAQLISDNGTLTIRNKDHNWFAQYSPRLVINCTSPELSQITLNGAGVFNGDSIASPDFKSIINGSGEVFLTGSTEVFYGAIHGAGSLHLEELSIDDAKIEINGAGDVKIPQAKIASIRINGAGDVKVSSETTIKEKVINGVGSVSY